MTVRGHVIPASGYTGREASVEQLLRHAGFERGAVRRDVHFEDCTVGIKVQFAAIASPDWFDSPHVEINHLAEVGGKLWT